MTKPLTFAIAIAALVIAAPSLAAETKGAGSTFVSPVMAKWTAAYKAKTGISVGYQPVTLINASIILKKEEYEYSTFPCRP